MAKKMKNPRYSRAAHFVFGTIFLLSSSIAFASTPDFLALSPEQLLGAEVISASKKAEPVSKVPAAVYVISSEDIARSGVSSIPDALRMAPGVNVAQGDSNSWAINIRGFNKGLANQLLVMVDGRTVYNPLFAGTYWELQNIPLETIDRIEVVRGPGGTLWGANAVNGVINIITKKAQDTQGNLVSAAAGNYIRNSEFAQAGRKRGEDNYYRVYAQQFNNGSFDTPQGVDAKDDWHDIRTGFRYDKGDALTVSGDIYTNKTRQLVSVPQLTAPYAVTRADELESIGANILMNWRKTFDDNSLLTVRSYVDHTMRDQIYLHDEESTFDIDAQYNLPKYGRNEIIIGGGYRLVHADIVNTPTLSIYPPNTNRDLFNVFMQDKITLMPEHWYLTLGSKLEHNDYSGFEIEPNARLEWNIDGKQSAWGAISRAIRMPSPLERDLDLNAAVFPPGVVPIEYNLIGNSDFESEELVAYELGYRNQVTSTFSTDVAAFYNRYDGLSAQEFLGLVFVPPLPFTQYALFQTRQANLMTAETYGGEIAASWNITDDWKLSGSYSVLEMSLHLNNDFTNAEAAENQSPQHQANLRSYWNINKDWTLDTSVYYVSELNAFDVSGYVRVDANLGWHIKDGLRFNLVGQNLLQSDHREYGNATDMNATDIPRTVFGKLTWSF